jgi:predicted acetyltransferase
MSSRPHHFKSLLPKLYQPDDRHMQAHYAIKRGGRIRAVIGHYPMRLIAGRFNLSASGIGAVSTHPDERQSGLMRKIMQEICADQDREQIALSVLGGQRQRYGYFGYERSGTSMTFSLNKTNLRHGLSDRTPGQIRFERLKSDSVDHALLRTIKSWHDRQVIHIDRPEEDFLTILSSWQAHIWLARAADDRLIGYLVSDRDDAAVSEWLTADPADTLALAAGWVDQSASGTVVFAVSPWQISGIAALEPLAETVRIDPSYQYRINDWPQVLCSLLEVKNRLSPLPEGSIRLAVTRSDQLNVFELSLAGGRASCAVVPATGVEHILDQLTATRLVLGPLPPGLVCPELAGLQTAAGRLFAAWFPLPLFWPQPDCV